MKYMFYGCENIKYINLFCFNTRKCIDMSHMFEKCRNIKDLDLSSFRVNNIIDMNNMFADCLKINNNLLEKVDFKQLQQLNLSYNKISDIKVLEKVNFKQLQYLKLSDNQISDNKENLPIINYLDTKIQIFFY